jgi:hypothetical protein
MRVSTSANLRLERYHKYRLKAGTPPSNARGSLSEERAKLLSDGKLPITCKKCYVAERRLGVDYRKKGSLGTFINLLNSLAERVLSCQEGEKSDNLIPEK